MSPELHLPAPHLPRLGLDPKRIAATSAAIAIHLFALMLMLAPVQWSPPVAVAEEDPTILVEEKKLEETPPPKIEKPREITREQPKPIASPPVMEQLENKPIDSVVAQTDTVAPDEGDFGGGGTQTEVFPTGLQDLTVLEGPSPTYPLAELRAGIEGRVVLRIEVDATGRPFGGVIEKSSGSRGLDRAALKFVLAKWRFVPPMYMGGPIASTVLVPIEFVINE